jgi:uncharacterized membrane protein
VIVWLFAIGRMVGLGNVVGIRPSLTLAILGIVSRLGWGPGLNAEFSFLSHWLAIIIFVVLAIFESSFDKIPKLDRLQGRLTMPYRVLAGAVAGAATIHLGWQGILVGVLVGGASAWFSQFVKRLTRPRTVPSDNVLTLLSTWEDLAALTGTLLTLFIAPVGYGIAAFTAGVWWRMRSRRLAKYRELDGGGY